MISYLYETLWNALFSPVFLLELMEKCSFITDYYPVYNYTVLPFTYWLQLVENDKIRNGNREALTALRKRARTTKTSVPSAFESIMKDIEGSKPRPLVKEVCTTCGNHDSNERTWMMFPGTDMFARTPFHAAHTVLETGLFLPWLFWYRGISFKLFVSRRYGHNVHLFFSLAQVWCSILLMFVLFSLFLLILHGSCC